MEVPERLVFLDTETTGLDPRLGHRIIEVAAVEAIGRELTGNQLHSYLDPEREVDPGAMAVHGISWDDLRGKPKFATISDELLNFMSGARVIIHNATFDISFIDQELARLRQPPIAKRGMTITDSLLLAREKFPGKRNSLDALCDRLGVDNAHRNLHGALLDARLLAEVYFALTRGLSLKSLFPLLCSTPIFNICRASPNNQVLREACTKRLFPSPARPLSYGNAPRTCCNQCFAACRANAPL